MNSEIGSEFWLLDLPDCPNKNFFSVENYKNQILTGAGRSAIRIILSDIESRVCCKKALLPGFICDSVIQTFQDFGYECFFYDISKDLSPSLDVKNIKRWGVFFHLGYFGFQTNAGLIDYLKKQRENNVIIIEDITHTLYSKKIDFESDYYVASLRKWLGIPGGGWLASRFPIEQPRLKETEPNYSILRKEALMLKGRYFLSKNHKLKQEFLNKFALAEKMLEEELEPHSIDPASSSILSKMDISSLKRHRRTNFSYLLDGFRDGSVCTPVFSFLPPDVVPLFFPVYVLDGRDRLRNYLSANKVYCPIHWPKPKMVDVRLLTTAKFIYDNILSIPCDQRYTIINMERIIYVLKKYVYY